MGFLAMTDTGSKEVRINSSNQYEYDGELGKQNPSGTYISLKAFSLGFESETEVDNTPNLTEGQPRTAVGSRRAIPINLKVIFDRTLTDRTTEEGLSPTDITETLLYLDKWANAKSIVMLYWMPDNENDFHSSHPHDWYSSGLRIIHTNNWSSSLLTKGLNGYSGATNYSAYAIPVVIQKITVDEQADSKKVDCNVSCFW